MPENDRQDAASPDSGDGSVLPDNCFCEWDEYVCDACCQDGEWHDRNC